MGTPRFLVLCLISASFCIPCILSTHRISNLEWFPGGLLHAQNKNGFLPYRPKSLSFNFSPCSPPMLPVTKIRPCLLLFMSGRKVWMVRIVPSRFTSRIPLIMSSDCASRGPISPTPALHTGGLGGGGQRTIIITD